jgi:hypothetical protein
MANEFIVRKGIVVSGASQQALRTVGNGNILIGDGTTDNGYLLDINGTVRVVNAFRSQNSVDWYRSDGTLVLGYNNSANVIDVNPNNNSSVTFRIRNSTNSFALSIAGDAKGVGFGIASANATIHTEASQTSSSSIARGVYFADTLTLAANGDTLIGLDVRPTFSVGSYSGYTLLSLRSSGDTLFTTTGGTNTLRTFRTGNVLVGSGSTDLGSTLSVIGSSLMSGNTSGSTLLNVVGSQGQLFSVVDTLTGSLMSVNDISGLPILEVFSDDRVVMGEYATNALVVSGRSTGFGVTPSDANYRIISSGSTLFSGGTMIVKGSGTTSGSTAFVVQNSTGGTLLNLFNNGNLNIDNGALYVNGDNGWVGIGTTIPTQKLHVNSGNAFINGVIYFGNSSHYLDTDNSTYAMLSSNRTLQLGTSGVPVLSVFTTQNVAIGTTTDSGFKLDVVGAGRVGNSSSYGTVFTVIAPGNSWTFDYQYLTAGTVVKLGGDRLELRNNSGTVYIGNNGDSNLSSLTLIGGVNGAGTLFAPIILGSGRNAVLNRETMRIDNQNQFVGIGTSTPSSRLTVSGTSLFTGTLTNLSGGSSGQLFSMDLSQSAVTGNTIYAINVSPTLRNTASGQTQVALRVMPTFTGSSTGTSTTNKIVDFGSQNVGTQFTVTDATTGDIYMVNDVSGLPIIAANSSWDVSMYNYPNTVFKKTNNSILLGVQNNTGSTVSIYGDLIINEGFGFTNTTSQVSGTTSTGATSAVTIYTLTTTSNKSYSVSCLTTGYGTSTRNTTSGKVEGSFKNSGGTLSMVGTTIQYVSADIISTNVDFELSGSSIVLRVTGTTTENYTWGSTITSQVI